VRTKAPFGCLWGRKEDTSQKRKKKGDCFRQPALGIIQKEKKTVCNFDNKSGV